MVYQALDAIFYIDRLGRTTQDSYDSLDRLDRLIREIDPLGRATKYTWCNCGSPATLTDPLEHITTWSHDLQGRLTR